MTEPTAHLDDEQLSDLLDGTGSRTDVDHVASCASCANRLDLWREVVRAVSVAPTPQPDQRRAAIDAALAGLHERTAAGSSPVVDIAAPQRHSRAAVLVRVAAAAAVLAVIGAVSAVAVRGGGRTNHQARTAAPSTQPASGNSASGTGQAFAAGPAASQPVLALGVIGNTGQLVAALKASTTAPAFQGTAEPPSASSAANGTSVCPAPSRHNEAFVEEGTLVWKGTPAIVFVFVGSLGHTALVVADTNCELLSTVSY
jgi:hypothetical protein